MTDRKITYYINNLSKFDFCGYDFYKYNIQSAFELPFKTNPTKGNHDFNVCEDCQKYIKSVTKELEEKYNGNKEKLGFPLCCESHSKLARWPKFNRVDYKDVPHQTALKIIYTNQHIINNYKAPSYYKEITDYIEYTVESFGQMPKDCGEPLFLGAYFYEVKSYITKNESLISKNKAKRILEYLDSFYEYERSETDLNILLNTYSKWLKIFPFQISFFKHLKKKFEKNLPILKGKPTVNKYTGIAKVKMHTKSSLIEVLVSLTNSIITQINTVKLYEKGLLTEPQKIRFELALNSRSLKVEKGYENKSQNEEQQYRRILKEWFDDEKAFLDEIKDLVNTESDNEFIKGNLTLKLIPQGDNAIYEIFKNGTSRKFSIKKYFDLYLQNWEYCIDSYHSKIDKLSAVNNAIFDLQKDKYNNEHPEVLKYIDLTIDHLNNIKSYINNNYPNDSVPVTLQEKGKGFTSKEWCTILFYSDYLEKKQSDSDKDVVLAFRQKHNLPYAETTFIQNFKEVKGYIEKSKKQSIKLIESILPYFKNTPSKLKEIESELIIIKDEVERSNYDY